MRGVLVEFIDVVRKRRMVRNFTDESVPQETLERIIATAQRAPSGIQPGSCLRHGHRAGNQGDAGGAGR